MQYQRLRTEGIRDLSLRNLAASLGLAPNAIYRYFSDRSALEAALANEAARQLGIGAEEGSRRVRPGYHNPRDVICLHRVRKGQRHLYGVMMSLHAPEHDSTFRQSLWTFTVEQVQRIADRTELRRRLLHFGHSSMEPWH